MLYVITVIYIFYEIFRNTEMDAFGDDFTAVNDVDPAAEFLAREHDQLAGLEDLIPEVSQTQPIESVQGGQS